MCSVSEHYAESYESYGHDFRNWIGVAVLFAEAPDRPSNHEGTIERYGVLDASFTGMSEP